MIGGVAGTYIAARVNLKKSYQEKWWVSKSEAYSKITEALHHSANSLEEWENEEQSGGEFHFSEEKRKQLSEDYSNASRDLSVATGVGAYIISNEVAKVLADLKVRQREIERQYGSQSEPRFESYAADAKAQREALAKVRALAKEDLKVR